MVCSIGGHVKLFVNVKSLWFWPNKKWLSDKESGCQEVL